MNVNFQQRRFLKTFLRILFAGKKKDLSNDFSFSFYFYFFFPLEEINFKQKKIRLCLEYLQDLT